jgi:hypothetical protein
MSKRKRALGPNDEMEAARQFSPLDPSKNKDYGNAKGKYNWDPDNKGPKKCYYETGDEADRCYVTTNGGPGGQKKPSSGPAGKNNSPARDAYNKKYRKQRMKEKRAFEAAVIQVAFENPGVVREALMPTLAKIAKGKLPPEFLKNIQKKKDEAKDDKSKDDKDDKAKDDKGKPPWLDKKAAMDLPGVNVRDIAQLRRVVDDQTYKLMKEVYRHLTGIFSDREEQALNRLRRSLSEGTSWSAEMHQNNIFKAADLLGISLPHMHF